MKYTGPITMSSQPGVVLQQYGTISAVGNQILLEQNGHIVGTWSDTEAAVTVQSTQRAERYLPGWAIALGILGLLFFLIGILFFFVRQTRWVTETSASVTVGGVPVVSLQVTQQELVTFAAPQYPGSA